MCDEPVSSLDVSIAAQVLNLLLDLKEKHGLSYLFISHDLAVVSGIADRIAVMYLGRIVEEGRASDVIARPLHPYSATLVSAALEPDPSVPAHRDRPRGRAALAGHPASGVRVPSAVSDRPAPLPRREPTALRFLRRKARRVFLSGRALSRGPLTSPAAFSAIIPPLFPMRLRKAPLLSRGRRRKHSRAKCVVGVTKE